MTNTTDTTVIHPAVPANFAARSPAATGSVGKNR